MNKTSQPKKEDLSNKVDKATLKSKIERVLSEILSDKHNAKITLKFTKQEDKE